MDRLRFNRWVFVLEALNSLGTSYYFNYLFFYLKAQFGFTSVQNLGVCALNGFVFMIGAYIGGKYGQRKGYLHVLMVGSVIMMVTLGASAFANTAGGIILLMVFWTVGMCFTWPNLEALAADHMPASALPKTIGRYNVVWSAGGALAYFSGGALAERFGWDSIFWIPLVLHSVQLGVCLAARDPWKAIMATKAESAADLSEQHPRGPLFLRLAWIANPFAYIAINAIIPLIPDLAIRLQLSAAAAGVFGSVWFFARMLTFAWLAVWPGWHYRLVYLLAAYAGMLACFAGILLLNSLWLIVLVQVAFGWCIGLIYYSSLYYSMHVGDTKAEHGGLHEAAIGAGIFGGPAIGAASLLLAPGVKQSGVIGVAAVLMIGFGILASLTRKQR